MNPLAQLTKSIGRTLSKYIPNGDDTVEGQLRLLQDEKLWSPLGEVGGSLWGDYKNGSYENGYPSISRIMNTFAAIEPYMIDDKAKTVEKSNPLDRLYSPNRMMSAYDFREALCLMYLVHDEVYVRVHHSEGAFTGNGKINPDKITGYTFIEDTTPSLINGKRTFILRNGEEITTDEVLVINSANPYDLSHGYSATRAAHRWTRIDDYIADYQAGFFKNGAVPAGQFLITAKTKQDYLDIKKAMQEKHRGAKNSNNVTYSWRPVDDKTGKPTSAQIEWVPFNTANKDLALKDLFEVVNNKVDSTYGVPAEIRGHLQNSNYASVSVAEKVFINYTMRPITLKIWGKFTHELARVTGGFGQAITFDLATPQIAEEIKYKAEAKKVQVETFRLLIDAGYTEEAAVKALGLPKEFNELKPGKKPPVAEDRPEVTAPNENADAPNQPDKSSIQVKDKKVEPEKPAKKEHKHKVVSPTDRDKYEADLRMVIKAHMNQQVEEVITGLGEAMKKAGDNATDKEQDRMLALAMLGVLVPLVYLHGKMEQAKGIALILEAGLTTNAITPFRMTKAQEAAYLKYLEKVANSFNADTAEAIRAVIANGISEGAPRATIEAGLRGLIDDDYRISRLSITEVSRAQGRAGVTAMENIQDETGYTIKKVLRTTGDDPCPMCEALNGTEVGVDETFWAKGGTLIGTDGKEYVNNFVSATTADIHPFCQCIEEYEVVA